MCVAPAPPSQAGVSWRRGASPPPPCLPGSGTAHTTTVPSPNAAAIRPSPWPGDALAGRAFKSQQQPRVCARTAARDGFASSPRASPAAWPRRRLPAGVAGGESFEQGTLHSCSAPGPARASPSTCPGSPAACVPTRRNASPPGRDGSQSRAQQGAPREAATSVSTLATSRSDGGSHARTCSRTESNRGSSSGWLPWDVRSGLELAAK